MSTWLDPVGPHPRSVYWRRRVVTFAVLLAGLFLLTRACGSDQPPDLGIRTAATQTPVPLVSTYTPTPTPTPTTTATQPAAAGQSGATAAAATDAPAPRPAATAASATGPTPTAAGKPRPTTCAAQDIEVTVRADAKRYAATVKPKLYISVVNKGQEPCRFDVGSKALTLVVSSGSDRIWSSDDCQGAGKSDVRLLDPGKAFAAAAQWSRVRSAPGCPKGQPAAKPGTYVLSGSAGGVESQRRAVFLLD
jgi:hypothetical protein